MAAWQHGSMTLLGSSNTPATTKGLMDQGQKSPWLTLRSEASSHNYLLDDPVGT